MKLNKLIKRILNFFFFIDVTSMMKSLRMRQANADDFDKIEYINSTLKKPDSYPNLNNIIKFFRKSPLLSVIKLEKKTFLHMFFLHSADIILSLLGIYLAMQILITFESSSLSKFKLIHLFISEPQLNDKFLFAIILAFGVFFLNMLAASIHAQKLEREMYLEWKIPAKITQIVYYFLLNMSSKSRDKYQSGDITNTVQNDSQYITGFFAHAFVDFGVIIFACVIITAMMISTVGPSAWFGIGIIVLQIPLSLFFAWCGAYFHQRLMQYQDKRIHLVTEMIKGIRLLKYLSWSQYFEKDIKQINEKEFFQETKLSLQFCVSFSIITNIWMFISSAIFAGYLMISHGVRDASALFGVMWLAKLFGHQIAPLPWFLHTFAQSIVASKRVRRLFSAQTQDEEFENHEDSVPKSPDDLRIIQLIKEKQYHQKFSVSFEFDHVSFKYLEDGPLILKDVSSVFYANQMTAIVGPVGAGKSTLLKILTADYSPTSGTVFICIHLSDSEKNKRMIKVNLHTRMGVDLLRSVQTLVPQEPFILTSTIRENIAFEFNSISQDTENQNKIMNSLLHASLMHDLSSFSDHIETEIGERGVNLSGGQKQRISLARKFYQDSNVVLMDDPFSAVDTKTEKEIIDNIFLTSRNTQESHKTIIWTTHRLQHLNRSDRILHLENGVLHEQ